VVQLLISVRSIAEASACVHNGADIIDIKEPLRGSLGMASPETIRAIAREVPPRFPISAAMGEWMDWRREKRFPSVPAGLSYLKIGLSGAAGLEGWREDFGRFCRELISRSEAFSEPAWVAVAYSDHKAARSPRPEEVLDFAAANGFRVFLLDTFTKDGTSLFDCLGVEAVTRLAESARARGLEVALAGSLRMEELEQALAIGPHIVGVRTAVCHAGQRVGAIDPAAVRGISEAISPALVGVTTS
jgi:uncharacterized protein (UPF0264 family)